MRYLKKYWFVVAPLVAVVVLAWFALRSNGLPFSFGNVWAWVKSLFSKKNVLEEIRDVRNAEAAATSAFIPTDDAKNVVGGAVSGVVSGISKAKSAVKSAMQSGQSNVSIGTYDIIDAK